MTPNKFLQSFGSFKTGEDGYCKLATLSTKKEKPIYAIGFCFEIITNVQGMKVLRVQLNCNTIKFYSKTFLVHGKSHLEVIINNLRQKAQDKLCSILPYSDDEQLDISMFRNSA